MNTVYDDLGNTVRSIDAATELMRMQALFAGVITVKDQNGGSYKVDYGIDKSQKGTADFADDSTIVCEICRSLLRLVDTVIHLIRTAVLVLNCNYTSEQRLHTHQFSCGIN